MRITLFLLVAGMLSVSAHTYSQQITFKGKNVAFSTLLEVIRQQSSYTVFSTKNVLDATVPLTLDVRSIQLEDFLIKITANQPVAYQVEDKIISFFRKNDSPTINAGIKAKENQQNIISGQVVHVDTREGIEGVTVQIKGTNAVATTNSKGSYRLAVTNMPSNAIVTFRYVGMKPKELALNGQKIVNVDLEPTADAIKDVVVTGIYQRNKESFTGSSSTYTVKELQMIGNQGILQALKTLDPSFAIVDNNQFGSDPNRLPDIEIRGKSSVIGLTEEFGTNPNQPLFILDGFESTLAIIADLSMDRVESITLLKDAAASAIYGSKAANGVVVVETKRPIPGSLRVNYNLSSAVNFADLTDYNLMNGEEKLEFERLSGFYSLLTGDGGFVIPGNQASQDLYYQRLQEVRRGVDTYWMHEPIRTSLNQRHTLFTEGGDANLRYSASFNYGLVNGVMKGSDRQTTSGNIRLLYRKGNFSVNNSLSIDNIRANREASPFADFSRSNPYFRKYDDLGNVRKVLEDFRTYGNSQFDPIFSPLYDKNNTNINKQISQGFTNNFEMEWRMMESLRARGRFGIRNLGAQDQIFRSPFNVEFEYRNSLEKGSYDESNAKNLNYDGEVSLTFGKVLNEKHTLNAVAGMRMEQATMQKSAYQVRGFVDDEFANPNFALGYPEGKRSDYQESKRRGASFYMNTGYAYDQKYLFDATIRFDGSSVYGSDRRFSQNWSLGLGWNIHKEIFMVSQPWVNQLRLRGSIGTPGNQNFDDYISMRIYRYNNENRNPFGPSLIINKIGNKNLQWQTTLDRNVGVDLITLDNRLRMNFDYFVKTTDPLLIILQLPSSAGVQNVAQNFGEQLTKGFTGTADYTVVRRKDLNWRINLNVRQLHAEYRNMGNRLNNFNESNKSRNLTRYYDGGSPSDLWAVRSAGIDPATGREIFIKKNGEHTFVHNYQDELVVGNSDPSLEGVIGTNLSYRGFLASVNLRYRVGGQAFMQTLYEKVENISTQGVPLNQDRRALYDRWKNPGDEAKFKAISVTESTPMSSRFVENNNMIIGESFSLGYETTTAAWLKAIRTSSLTFRVYMNDIFHVSTIKNERGIDYPFARSVSFSAAIRF